MATTLMEAAVDERDLIRARRDRVRFLHVPERHYLAIDGTEAPGGEVFQQAIGTLYPVAYTLHFSLRKRGVSAPVGALEGLFWIPAEDLLADTPTGVADGPPAGGWRWRLLLRLPEEAGEVEIEQAIADAARKRPLPALEQLRVLTWEEGDCAQILHVGPYDAEAPTIRRLHDAIGAAGLRTRGQHHEIYLSDPGRGNPQKTRTVIRQPVA